MICAIVKLQVVDALRVDAPPPTRRDRRDNRRTTGALVERKGASLGASSREASRAQHHGNLLQELFDRPRSALVASKTLASRRAVHRQPSLVVHALDAIGKVSKQQRDDGIVAPDAVSCDCHGLVQRKHTKVMRHGRDAGRGADQRGHLCRLRHLAPDGVVQREIPRATRTLSSVDEPKKQEPRV